MKASTHEHTILATSRKEAEQLAAKLLKSGHEPTITPKSGGVYFVTWPRDTPEAAA